MLRDQGSAGVEDQESLPKNKLLGKRKASIAEMTAASSNASRAEPKRAKGRKCRNGQQEQ
jgi:hypothetical protein